MNNKEYVITALKVRDYKGNMLDEPEVVYASIDNVGIMATGYPFWSDTYRHNYVFSSIKNAEKFFYTYQEYLLEEDRIDSDTICVREIQYIEVEKLNILTEEEEVERKEKEELKRLLEKYGNDADIVYGNFNGSNPYDDNGWDGE